MSSETQRKPADLAGSVVTGGLGGGSLVAFAQKLTEDGYGWAPYLALSAPLLASLWAAAFPRVLRWAEGKVSTRQWKGERSDALQQITEIIVESRATLASTGASDVKDFLEQRIAKLELEQARIATATPGTRPWTNIQIRTAPTTGELVPQAPPAAVPVGDPAGALG